MRPISIAVALAAALAAAAPSLAQEVPARWGPYAIELVDEAGRVLPTFDHRGRVYVLGALGQRYLLRIRNGSARRIEVVASVDGRDVVDGRPAAFDKRGYVVPPYGEVIVEGYRLSQATVAAFRFSTVPRSYAARKGDARDVGVVGVAIFPERSVARVVPPYRPPYRPPPYPGPTPWSGPPSASAPSGAVPEPSEGRAERRAAPEPSAPPSAGDAPLAEAPRPGIAPRDQRPGLGTEFGEEHESRVEEVPFVRASARPEAVLTLRYDDRPGLLALGIDVDGDRLAGRDERRLRESATPFRGEGYCEPPPGWER